MNPDDPIPNIWATWDKTRPCTVPPEYEWTLYLYGAKPVPRAKAKRLAGPAREDSLPSLSDSGVRNDVERSSIMVATAFRAIRSVDESFSVHDAKEVTEEHYVAQFAALLAARKPEFNCASFEALCKLALRQFATKWAIRVVRNRPESGDAPLTGADGDSVTLFGLIGVEPDRLTPTERDELNALFQRALADLPEDDKKFAEKFTPEGENTSPADEEPSLEVDELSPAMRHLRRHYKTARSMRERKAKSRAEERLQQLLKVHEQSESREGVVRIERAVLICVDDPTNRTLVTEHLLRRQSLDKLRKPRTKDKPEESADEVRYRFLRVVEAIFPVVDPERVRALELLPDKHRIPIRAAFFPPRPIEDVARSQEWKLTEAYLHIRSAIDDLRVLQTACENTKSPPGRQSLEKRAAALPSPARDLILRVLIAGESLSTVAALLNLSEDQAREILLAFLR